MVQGLDHHLAPIRVRLRPPPACGPTRFPAGSRSGTREAFLADPKDVSFPGVTPARRDPVNRRMVRSVWVA